MMLMMIELGNSFVYCNIMNFKLFFLSFKTSTFCCLLMIYSIKNLAKRVSIVYFEKIARKKVFS